jgi:rubrerythrin
MYKDLDDRMKGIALRALQAEVNEYHIYTALARLCKNKKNADVLHSLAQAEKEHAGFWADYTGIAVRPQRIKVWQITLLARLFGLTFTLKRMEKREGSASKEYLALAEEIPEVRCMAGEEAEHEQQLLNMLDEDILKYAGSVVLGLNDALVELTGSLAGFTLALGDTRLVS